MGREAAIKGQMVPEGKDKGTAAGAATHDEQLHFPRQGHRMALHHSVKSPLPQLTRVTLSITVLKSGVIGGRMAQWSVS